MNAFETNDFMSNFILILILKGKRAVHIQLYIFYFVVREFCIRESPVE